MIANIASVNAAHNLNIKKDDIKTFTDIKPYYDKFINIILMDNPVLTTNLENVENYSDGNEDYLYSKAFYKTFKLSDDGYDDINVVKTVRYAYLLQYILNKINGTFKFNFNLVDVAEPKIQKLLQIMSILSSFAKFQLTMNDNIKQIIKDIGMEKIENDKLVENILTKEQELLKNDYNYEDLKFNEETVQKEVSGVRENIDIKSKRLNEIKSDNDNIKLNSAEMTESQKEVNARKAKVLQQIEDSKQFVVEDPAMLTKELTNQSKLLEEENERLQQLFVIRSDLNQKYKQSLIVRPANDLLREHLSLLWKTTDNFESIRTEMHKLNRPEIEKINYLKVDEEKRMRNIKNLQEKYSHQQEKCSRYQREKQQLQLKRAELTEKLELITLKKQNHQREINKYKIEFLNENKRRQEADLKYTTNKGALEENIMQSLAELSKNY